MMLTSRYPFAAVTILVSSFAPPVAASAKDVKVGSTSINLTTPPGFCELDAGSTPVKGLRELLAAKSQLLAAYADCQSNFSLPLDNFAHYSVVTGAINVILPADAIKQICASMRENGEKALTTFQRNRASDIAKIFDGLKISETRFFGVVAEDSVVCYTALVQKLLTETGVEKILVGISAAMNIKGKLISYILYSPYVNSGTVDTMLDKHKSNISVFFAANRN
jgi:hypothetical protein